MTLRVRQAKSNCRKTIWRTVFQGHCLCFVLLCCDPDIAVVWWFFFNWFCGIFLFWLGFFRSIKGNRSYAGSGRSSSVLQMATVTAISMFLSSVAKFSPITGGVTDPRGWAWIGMEALVRGLVSVETALPSPLAPHTFSAMTEPARRGGSPCLGWVLCLMSFGLLISHFTLKTNPSEGYNPNMSETECMINLTSPHFGRGDAASSSLTWLSQGLSRRKSHIWLSALASCNSASSTWLALTRLLIFLTQDNPHPPLLAVSGQTHQGFRRWELSSWIPYRT